MLVGTARPSGHDRATTAVPEHASVGRRGSFGWKLFRPRRRPLERITSIGVVGLGNTGSAMAGHLVDAGHDVAAFVLDDEAVKRAMRI
jgi:hypothetical protein